MIYLFWPHLTQRHQCVPLKLNEKNIIVEKAPMQNKDADELIYFETDQAQCPICLKKYNFGLKKEFKRKELLTKRDGP